MNVGPDLGRQSQSLPYRLNSLQTAVHGAAKQRRDTESHSQARLGGSSRRVNIDIVGCPVGQVFSKDSGLLLTQVR